MGYVLSHHQSCPTLCDAMDYSLPGSSVHGILQARTLKWAAIAFSVQEGKVKVKSLIRVRLFATPWTVAYHAPLSMRFSKQEYWNGLPFPSPGIFPTQGSNPGLSHCRQMLYHLSHQGSPNV